MKRYISLLMFLGLVLSACTIRVDVGVDINEDESGVFALFMGFDEEFQQLAEQGGGEDLSLTQGLEDLPPGWDAVEVVEDGFDGTRISTEFDSLDGLEARLAELGSSADTGVGTDFLSDFELTHEGDEFRFKVDVTGLDQNLADAMGGSGGEDLLSGMDPTSLIEDLFEIRFKLTLPGTIGDNNADEIDGNTLIWNVGLGDEGGTYEAVSSTGSSNSALLLGIAAVAALVVVGVGVTAVRRRKKAAVVNAVDSAPITTEAPPIDPVS